MVSYLPRSSCQEIGRYPWYLFLPHLSISPVDPIFQICLESCHCSAHLLCTTPPPRNQVMVILSPQLLTLLLFLPLRTSPHTQSDLYVFISNPSLPWSQPSILFPSSLSLPLMRPHFLFLRALAPALPSA